MQRRPPETQTVNLSDLIESINLDGFKGKLIIRIEALHIELHLSGHEPLDSDSLNGEEGERQA